MFMALIFSDFNLVYKLFNSKISNLKRQLLNGTLGLPIQ